MPRFAQIASIPVGYNNPELLKATQSLDMQSAIINRPALASFPQHDWLKILQGGLLAAAPKGLDKIYTSMTGSDANEMAYKAAFMWKRQHERGVGTDFTEAEVASSMENQLPGAPNMSILSFKKGFHGRLFGSLSTTRSKAIHKCFTLLPSQPLPVSLTLIAILGWTSPRSTGRPRPSPSSNTRWRTTSARTRRRRTGACERRSA